MMVRNEPAKKSLKRFRFQCGAPEKDPIEFSATVMAANKEDALARLKLLLPESESSLLQEDDDIPPVDGENLDVYFNVDAITLEHIEEVNE